MALEDALVLADVTLRLFGRRMFRANYAPLTAAP